MAPVSGSASRACSLTSYRSRTASIKKAASSEKSAMRDDIAYRGTLSGQSDPRLGGGSMTISAGLT